MDCSVNVDVVVGSLSRVCAVVNPDGKKHTLTLTFVSGLSVFCQKDLFKNYLKVPPWSETFNRVRFFRFNNVVDRLSDAVTEAPFVLDLIHMSEAMYTDTFMDLKTDYFSVSSLHPIQSEILYTLKLFFFSPRVDESKKAVLDAHKSPSGTSWAVTLR